MPYNIVLVTPEIPTNTGNIGRLCLATGSTLHLIKPFGFELDNSRLKRAGLDYWKHLSLVIYEDVDEFFIRQKDKKMIFFSSHATKLHWNIPFEDNMFLVFGKESVGLPISILEKNPDNLYKIPMYNEHIRSLNLSNAVAIAVYEGLKYLY
jgi:tRNA (cytidine/uridine-2'-O-)-methyltransferase